MTRPKGEPYLEGAGELERQELEVRDRIIRRMIRDGMDAIDICEAVPSMTRAAVHARVYRIRRKTGTNPKRAAG